MNPEQIQLNYDFDTPSIYEVFVGGEFIGTVDLCIEGTYVLYDRRGQYVGSANDLSLAVATLRDIDKIVFVGYEASGANPA